MPASGRQPPAVVMARCPHSSGFLLWGRSDGAGAGPIRASGGVRKPPRPGRLCFPAGAGQSRPPSRGVTSTPAGCALRPWPQVYREPLCPPWDCGPSVLVAGRRSQQDGFPWSNYLHPQNRLGILDCSLPWQSPGPTKALSRSTPGSQR